MPAAPSRPTQEGLYTRFFVKSELEQLIRARREGLLDEVDALRLIILRTLELANGIDDLKEMLGVLRSISTAAGRVASLLTAHARLVEGRGSRLEMLLNQAVSDALAEMYRTGRIELDPVELETLLKDFSHAQEPADLR